MDDMHTKTTGVEIAVPGGPPNLVEAARRAMAPFCMTPRPNEAQTQMPTPARPSARLTRGELKLLLQD